MLALENIYRRKARSLLTIVGIGVGVAAVVAMVSTARGMRSQFNAFLAGGNAHLVASKKAAADPFISYLPDGLAGELQEAESVSAVHPVVLGAVQIPGQPLFFFFGTTAGSPLLAQLRTIAGRDLFDATGGERRLCLGRRMARILDKEVGDSLELDGEAFEVTGLFETSVPLLESGGLLAFEDAQDVAGLEGKMSMALIQLDSVDRGALDGVEKALEEAFPEVEVTRVAEFANAFDEFDLTDDAVRVFSLLAMLIGGIGVMNTMLTSVFERTREIGILRALGWSKGMILRQILAEAAALGLLGGPLGIALGIGGVELISLNENLAWVSGEYGLTVFLQAMAVAVGMGLLGATWPTLRAVGITPIQALRYE